MPDRSIWTALVVGNSDYDFEAKVSGRKDAEAIGDCLSRLGIGRVETIVDGTFDEMDSALRRWEKSMDGSEAVIFSYSGHGFQQGGRNFLIPKDGAPGTSKLFAVDEIIQRFAAAPDDAVKIAFFNACRQNGPTGGSPGFANPGTTPLGVLQAFAASPGQLAASGLENQLSPYAKALVENLVVPGLELGQLLENVRVEILGLPEGQQPFIAGALPTNFFFRDAVEIKARVSEAPNDSLVVILNGNIELNTAESTSKDIPLKAGGNDVVMLVSHGRTYRNGQTWGPTEGWHYQLDLVPSEGTDANFDGHFEGKEEVPFKDGPRHGRAFVVAKARIDVDSDSVTLVAAETDKDFWKHDPETPVYAQDQETLFESSIVDLGLIPDDILGDVTQLGVLKSLAGSIIASILRTGEILPGGPKVADPSKTFFIVRGNRALRQIVQTCFTDLRAHRIRDLRASVAAAFNRVPRPFDLFDQGLNEDMRAIGKNLGLDPDDLRVWTAIDDRSHEAPEGAAVRAVASMEAAAIAPDLLQPLPGEILLGPIPADQTVQGVPVSIQVFPFVTFAAADSQLKVHARIIADLSDFQNKIGAIVDTIPLPKNPQDHFGLDNVVVRIWGKQITIDGNIATLNLNGDVDVWAHLKNPIPCTRLVFDGIVPRVETFDCNPPIDRQVLNQPFDASLPFTVSVADTQALAVTLGEPAVRLGGTFSGVTNGILRIAGVDLNAQVKAALDQAIPPGALRQTLPDFVLAFNPTLTRAKLVSYSGALALLLEMDGEIGGNDLARVFEILTGHH